MYKKNINFIPVFGLDRDEAYLHVIKNHLGHTKYTTVCLRLLVDDLDDLDELKVEIARKLGFLNLEPKQCDLLVDFKTIESNQVDSIMESLSQLNLAIPLKNWRSFILGASSFPEDMSNIKKNSHETIRRVENDLWQATLMAEPLIGRRPIFADYSVNNPTKPEVEVTTMRAVAKIRYTTKETWEVFRGHSLLKGEKFAQYFNLSKMVVDSEYYLGSEYSWGDAKIKQCATERKKTGNLPTWVQIDTNHHLTIVGEHVASFDAP